MRHVRIGARDVPLDPRVAVAHVRRELLAAPRALRLWLLASAGLLALGGGAALLSVPPGAEVFGTTPPVDWGLLIAHYVFLVTTTSGLCLVSGLGHVFGIERFRPIGRRAAVLAVAFLTAGFIVIAVDLHYPVRLLVGVVLSPSPQSPMWWMGTVYGVYLACLLVELAGMFLPDARLARIGATLTVGAAVVAPTTLGAVFAMLVSRPAWHDPGTPLTMLVTAILSGLAALGITLALVERLRLRGHGAPMARLVSAVGIGVLVGSVIVLYLAITRVLTGLYGGVPLLADSVVAQLGGPLALLYWPRVLGGLVAPIWILARRRGHREVLAASALAFGGMFLDRVTFVLAGQIAPITTAGGAIADPWFAYVPSPVELAVAAGALGFVGLAYGLVEVVVDLSEPAHGGVEAADVRDAERGDAETGDVAAAGAGAASGPSRREFAAAVSHPTPAEAPVAVAAAGGTR